MPDDGSFPEMLKRSLEQSRISRQVRTAVRAAAQGQTRDRARELLVDELRARGQKVPAQPWLDVRLDAILADDSPLERVKMTVEAAKLIGGAGRTLFKLVQSARGPEYEREGIAGLPPPYLTWDKDHTVEVALDDDAQEWIGDLAAETVFTIRTLGAVHLELRRGSEDAVEVCVRGRRAGVVRDPDAEAFRSLFPSRPDRDPTLVALGGRYHDPDGTWRLYISPPNAFFRRLRNRWNDAP